MKSVEHAKIYPMADVKDYPTLIETIKNLWIWNGNDWHSICKLIKNFGFEYIILSHYKLKGPPAEISDKLITNIGHQMWLSSESTKILIQMNSTIYLISYKPNFFVSTEGICKIVKICIIQ